MSESTTAPSAQQRILAMAADGNGAGIEEAWIDLASNPPVDPEFYKQIIKCMKRAGKLDSALEMFLVAFEELQKKAQWRALEKLVAVAVASWPASEPLRKQTLTIMRARHAKLPDVEGMLTSSGLKAEVALDQAFRKFREYLRLVPGQAYSHVSWGEGIVTELDLAAGKAKFDFKTEKGKSLTFEGVKNYLTYLPPNHILAKRAKDPKALQAMAEENPLGLVKLAVESSGGKLKQADLKAMLLGSIIQENDWTSWWGKARQAVRLEPMMDLDASGGARAMISVREKPRTLAEEIEDLFFAPDCDFETRVTAVQRLTQAKATNPISTDLIRRMIDRLEKDFRTASDDNPMRTLGLAYLIEDLKGLDAALKHHTGPVPKPDSLLGEIHDYANLTEIEHIDYSVRALHHLLARDGSDGAERAAQLLPKAPAKLAQAIWKEFDLEHHRTMAAEAIEALLENPLENPDTYAWAARMILEGHWRHLEEHFSLPGMVMALIDGIEEWNDIAEDSSSGKAVIASARQLVTKMKTLLSAKGYAAICGAAEAMTLDQAQRLRQSLHKNGALNAQFKAGVARQLLLTRKDLDATLAGEPRKVVETDLHLCTPKARKLKTIELRELTGVKIPANSKAIDEARQEGDLKENAGYHAAKDEQKILMQQMLTLQEALSSAQVVHKESIRGDVIAFGTSFNAENKNTGATENYTILGKWEANPEKRILSIQAPFAQQFLGKKAGEEVQIALPVGGQVPYRVISIENALATGDWDEEDGEED